MAATDDQETVEAVFAEGPHPALRIGVRVRCPNRRPDHPAALGTQELVNPAAELRIAIMDQQPKRLVIAELHHQVARLLRRPDAVRVRRARDVLDPSPRKRDEEKHVDALQERSLNGQEVAGQRGRRLLTQEHTPRQAGPLRRGRHTPASTSTPRPVVAETVTPSPFNSPTILRYPQRGFSFASRRISVTTEGSSGGLPGLVHGYVQRRAPSRR